MTRRLRFAGLAMIAMLAAHAAFAVPNLLQYQGRVTDAAGTPLNGSQSVVFSIYAAASGGSALWSETQTVTVANGLFNVALGSVTALPADLFDGSARYLGVKVGADAEMTPRQAINSVGYAQRAGAVDLGPGVAQGHVGGAVDFTGATASYQDVASVSITAPAGGYILVIGDAQLGLRHAPAEYAGFQITDVSNGPEDAFHYFLAGSTPNAPYTPGWVPASIHRIYAVSAGSYTYYLQCRNWGGVGTPYAWDPTITAVYFPTAMGGVATILGGDARPASARPVGGNDDNGQRAPAAGRK